MVWTEVFALGTTYPLATTDNGQKADFNLHL